jgi:hypothetical protein
MVRVNLGTSTDRRNVTANVTDTLKKTLTDNGVNLTNATVHIDGALAQASELNKTFADFGIADGSDVSLIAVVKAQAAR